MTDNKNNTGNLNAGDCNTGNNNTGNYNTGHRNTGHRNTGNFNTGYRNTGNFNTGNFNTGNFNTCDRETGFFNTQQSDTVRVFNKDTSRDAWDKADKPNFLYFALVEWVGEDSMTDKEKIDNDTYSTTGGYLKTYDYKEAFQKSYNEASAEDKALLLKLPNFDADIFLEISGIEVREVKQTCEGKIVVIDGVKYKLSEV